MQGRGKGAGRYNPGMNVGTRRLFGAWFCRAVIVSEIV